MSTQKYHLKRCELDLSWDKLVKNSPNGTPFISTGYLNALIANIHAYYCFKGDEIMAGVLLIVSNDGKEVIGHDLVIYDGLFYRDLSHLNQAQYHSEQFAIQTFISELLPTLYHKISLRLHPSITDIRPILWVNYGKELPKYQLYLRYTSYLTIDDFKPTDELKSITTYNQASVARRQEIRYARKKEVHTSLSDNIDLFIHFYQKTLLRQDIVLNEFFYQETKQLVSSLLNNKQAHLVQSINKAGDVGSMAVFLLGENTAYYLFGANDPDMRNQHTGTAVIWEHLFTLQQQGITCVDLEGINSPQRGWFKLSFGGTITPYYQLNYSN